MNHVYSRQVFTRHTVYLVRQLLHHAKTRQTYRHNCQYRCANNHHERRRYSRKFPTLSEDLDNRPNRHDRGFYHHLQAHGNYHLNLVDVIRRSRYQARHGKILHLRLADVCHTIKNPFSERVTESRRRLRRKITARNGKRRARQRAGKHFQPDGHNISRCVAARFYQQRQLRHKVGQPQVKIHLSHNEDSAQKRRQHLALSHIFKQFYHFSLSPPSPFSNMSSRFFENVSKHRFIVFASPSDIPSSIFFANSN